MRILIVSQYFWPEEFRVNDLAVDLHERGHEVTVLTGFPNYPHGMLFPGYAMRSCRRETYRGVSVVRLPLYPDRSYSWLRRGWNYLSFALSASLLGPLVVGRVDRIVVFQPGPVTVGLPAIVLKYLRRAPIFFWVQDPWPDTLEALGVVRRAGVLAAVRRLVRFIYRHSDTILVQSPGLAHRITALGVDQAKVAYLPNWAEDVYRPVPRDEALGRDEEMDEGFQVVFAGNIGRAQDFDTLLGAANLLRDEKAIRFVVLGDGAMARHYMDRVRAEGLGNVVFKGRKPSMSMPGYFALADALLVLLRNEPAFTLTIPSKVQGYLACGRPIVAALAGDAAEVVRESGAGIVCPPGDPRALADAVVAVYHRSDADRAAMGAAGLRYYRTHFDRRTVIDRLERLLDAGRAPAAGERAR